MKELYISPEVKLLCFAPVENLASGDGFEIDADTLFGNTPGGVSGNEDLDIDIPIIG